MFMAFAAAAGLVAAVPALGADPVKIRISTPAVDNDWHAKMLTIFKDELEKTAPGEFDVEIHLNGTLFAQGTEVLAMQRGNLEMGLISAQDIAKQIPAWSVFTAGYMVRDPAHQVALFDGDVGQEFFGMVEKEMGVKMLTVAYLGTRQLTLGTEKEIKTPADLSGVNLRMPSTDTWLFLGRALGANPVPVAFGEVYMALQTGAIDGQDNPLPSVRAAKFYEVSKQIVLTGHLVDGVFMAISGKTWETLSDAQKEKVTAAAKAARAYNNENRIKEEAELVAFFEQQGLKVSTPDVEAFRSTVQKAYLESEWSQAWPEGLADRINAVK
jgi:tripartite ATP-independent transporter DctP family solute receptor